MLICSVSSCGSRSGDVGVRFFKFPENYSKKWADVVNRKDWVPKKTSVICSHHFVPNDVCGNKL